jgi:hypothetical protein
MPALHAPVTAGAVAYGDAKLAHDGPHDRQIFVMLRGLAGQHECAATRRTRPRQRRLVAFVDVCRRWPMRLPSIRATRLAAGSFRLRARGPMRKGRGLAMPRAARLVQIVFEPVDLPAQLITIPPVPIPIAVGPLVLAPQAVDLPPLSRDLALLPLKFGDQLLAGGRLPSRAHAPVMARLAKRYKYDFLDPAYG